MGLPSLNDLAVDETLNTTNQPTKAFNSTSPLLYSISDQSVSHFHFINTQELTFEEYVGPIPLFVVPMLKKKCPFTKHKFYNQSVTVTLMFQYKPYKVLTKLNVIKYKTIHTFIHFILFREKGKINVN